MGAAQLKRMSPNKNFFILTFDAFRYPDTSSILDNYSSFGESKPPLSWLECSLFNFALNRFRSGAQSGKCWNGLGFVLR